MRYNLVLLLLLYIPDKCASLGVAAHISIVYIVYIVYIAYIVYIIYIYISIYNIYSIYNIQLGATIITIYTR